MSVWIRSFDSSTNSCLITARKWKMRYRSTACEAVTMDPAVIQPQQQSWCWIKHSTPTSIDLISTIFLIIWTYNHGLRSKLSMGSFLGEKDWSVATDIEQENKYHFFWSSVQISFQNCRSVWKLLYIYFKIYKTVAITHHYPHHHKHHI